MKSLVDPTIDETQELMLNEITSLIKTARKHGVIKLGIVGTNEMGDVISVAVICTEPDKAKRIKAILDEDTEEVVG